MPVDRIVVMMYDDVAHDPKNPFPGELYNVGSEEGEDRHNVYEGCKIDYGGENVTKENLFKVLTGDESAGGKVIHGDKDSKVFFYFVDHGAPLFVEMPNKNEKLYADELEDLLRSMKIMRKYASMVIYMDSCSSGSMFNHTLSEDLYVYAVTSTNSTELAWASYCDPFDTVNGVKMNTCLGDLFSNVWIYDTESSADPSYESL
jgi:legumain